MQRVHALTLAIAAAALTAGFAQPAAAVAPAGAEAPVSIVLKATDADLHTQEGARALAFRIRVAAATVCGADVDPVVRTGDGFYRCQAAAINAAVRSAHAPLLAQALGRTAPELAGADR